MLPSLAARDAQTAHSQFPCVASKLEHVSLRNCKDHHLKTQNHCLRLPFTRVSSVSPKKCPQYLKLDHGRERYGDSLPAGKSEVRIATKTRNSLFFKMSTPAPGPHIRGFLPKGKVAGPRRRPLTSIYCVVNNNWSHISIPPTCLQCTARDSLTFTVTASFRNVFHS